MAEEGKSRLGRGLGRPDRRGRGRGWATSSARASCRAAVPVEFLRAEPAQPAQRLRRPDLEELTAVDQAIAASSSRSWCGRSRHDRTNTRSSPASAAGARRRGPGCTRCRWWSSRSTTRTSLEYAILENVQRADLNPHRGGGGLFAPDGRVLLHAGKPLARSSARAAATSPTRSASPTCPSACARC